jgi:hypothetical protein
LNSAVAVRNFCDVDRLDTHQSFDENFGSALTWRGHCYLAKEMEAEWPGPLDGSVYNSPVRTVHKDNALVSVAKKKAAFAARNRKASVIDRCRLPGRTLSSPPTMSPLTTCVSP